MSLVRKIALIIVFWGVLCVWSNLVYKAGEKRISPGTFYSILKSFSLFPETAASYWKEREYINMSRTFIDADPSFSEISNLNRDLFVIDSHFEEGTNEWHFVLTNLLNDEIIYKWVSKPSFLEMEKYYQTWPNLRPYHTIINPDTSILINHIETESLMRLDKNSNVKWKNSDFGYHHSMNLDSAGYLWICGSKFGYNNSEFGGSDVGLINQTQRILPYQDNIICKVDIETGETIFAKSVSDILIENDLEGILFNSLDFRADPIHLNDVEPALTTTRYWNEGDLFISVRNLSLVFLYDPGANKVKRVISGPFLSQHDVDITSDSTIAVFDNRFSVSEPYVVSLPEEDLKIKQTLRSNRIVSYDFSTEEYSFPFLDLFESEGINTFTEGLFEYIDGNQVFVEEQNSGKVFILDESSVLLRKQFPVEGRDKVHMTNWIRVYEENPLKK